MNDADRPRCAWTGIDPADEGREIACHAPATYFIEEPDGHRIYSCIGHLSEARAHAVEGHLVHRIPGARVPRPRLQLRVAMA